MDDIKDIRLANLIIYLLEDNLWTQPSEAKLKETKEKFRRNTVTRDDDHGRYVLNRLDSK